MLPSRRISLVAAALIALLLVFRWSRDPSERHTRDADDRAVPSTVIRAGASQPIRRDTATPLLETDRPLDPRTRQLIAALDRGYPARLTVGGETPRTLLLQPRQMLAEDFRISLGVGGADAAEFDPQVVRVYGGRGLSDGGGLAGRATVSIVDNAIAAVIVSEDGDVLSIKTDPETGELLTLRESADEVLGACEHDPIAGTASVTGAKDPATNEDWLAGPRAQIAAAIGDPEILGAGGVNPGNGRLDKYIEPLPLGRNYDLSLRDMMVLVVLDKNATGANSTSRFTTVTSEYLARMANVAAIHEHNLGVRLLVQELILTPNSAGIDDVPASLGNFRDWVGANRPRGTYRWNAAAKFGNTATDGGVIGVAYVSALSGGNGVSVNNKGYGPALVSHEMGHNMGSGHSSGGIMNPSIVTSARTFFNDVSTGETAAKDIYDHTRTRIYGPATMRHPEQIPFAKDDDRTTGTDTPHVFNPVANDDNLVRNGTASSVLRLEEVSRVQPLGAGTVEISGANEVTFTPAAAWEGMAFFSYSIRGDVGNGGAGWLHKGDAAVQVGNFDRNSLDLALAPGQVFSFRPSGDSNPTINSQPSKAFAGTSRDDRKLIIIRVEAGASGSDSFTFSRDGATSRVNISYLPANQYLTATPDILFFEGSGASIDFNPLVNDQGGGYLSPASIVPTIKGKRPTTFYFRKSFAVTGVGDITGLDLDLLRDDGALVYLNGFEIARDNLPAGAIDFETFATDSVGGADETRYFGIDGLAATRLIEGQNVLAVEVHQSSLTSSDVAFDLSLTVRRPSGNTNLIPRASTWRYLDNGSDQGVSWKIRSFNDGSWNSGDAIFGFGDGREATTLASGFSSLDVIPGAFRIVSATNLDPAKGELDFSETRPFTIGGTRRDALTGLMSFTPTGGATGVGRVEYTAEDGAGNRTIGTVTIVLPLVTITEPTVDSAILDLGNGIQLGGIAHHGGSAPLSGTVTPSWSLEAGPEGGRVNFSDPDSTSTRARFSMPGDYTIRLTGSDNGFATFQERRVRVVDSQDSGSLGSGLAGWWKFDEGGGSVVADASGNGRDGLRISAGPTTGILGGALEFGASTGEFVNLGSHVGSFENLTQGSIACWFRTNTGSERVIFAAADGGDRDRDLRLYIDDGKLKYKVRGDIGTSEASLASAQKVNDNEWHHAAITVDAAMNATLYLDGESVATGVRPFFSGLFDIDYLRIGQTVNNSGGANPFRGKIDELRVYSRLISAEEVGELASASLNRAPLVSLPNTQPATGAPTFNTGALSPAVDDDGRPVSPGSVTLEWSASGGPGTVTFSDDRALATNATFSTPGIYTLQLSADDGEVTSLDEISIDYTGTGAGVPLSIGIADIIAHQNAPDALIDLFGVFEDAQDPDTSLGFQVVSNSEPSLFDSVTITVSDPRRLVLDYAVMGAGTSDLTVRATDTDGNSIDANFSVTVQNFQPEIIPQFFSLPEDSADGSVVGILSASDADGDAVSFAVLGGNTGGTFSIDRSSGLIRLADSAQLDFEAVGGYSLLVAVTDATHPQFSSRALVSINVSDVNEAPVIDAATIEVPETTPAGTVIGTLSARDPDGRPLRFEIVGGNGAGVFALDPDDGFLTLENTAPFALSSNPQFVIVVSVTDDGAPALSDTAEVRISPASILVREGASARVRVPTSSADDASWTGRGFNDASWMAGTTGIGFDTEGDYDPLINTDIEAQISGTNGTVYIRIPFNVPDPSLYGSLVLDVKYDDGFIAYLNGTEVASRNAPASPDWDSRASSGHSDDDAQVFESIDLSADIGRLVAGGNVLAIHGLNRSSSSSDLLILPRLSVTADVTAAASLALSPAILISSDSATLVGSVDDSGGDSPVVTFVWGRHDGGEDPSAWDHRGPLGIRQVGGIGMPITGLQPGRVYFFNAIASNAGGISTGGVAGTFTTALGDPITLVPEGADARGLVPANASPTDQVWRGRQFDDVTWEPGSLAAGYETGTGYGALIGAQLNFETEMFETNATLYLRVPFTPTNPDAIDRMTLRMKYDDGFVAYLNEVEVARRNAFPGDPIWNSAASANHSDTEATEFEVIDLSAFVGLLASGENILAIHGLNDGTDSSDMLISPELLGYQLGTGGGNPAELYDAWAQVEHGLGGAAALAGADPELDRLSNLLEYAFASDPNTASNGIAPAASQTRSGGIRLSFRRRIDAADRGLSYRILASTDLETWIPATIAATESVQPLPGGEAELVTVRLTASGERTYVRVAVDLAL